jgi:hypothetical protein
LIKAYIETAAVPAVFGKYRVRTIFGTNRQPGIKFGLSVPALFVRDPSLERAGDVYPHQKAGRYVTINDFLTGLLAAPVSGADSATKLEGKKHKRK